MAALVVGKLSADEHRIQEPATIGNFRKQRIALHGFGTHGVRSVQRLARIYDVGRPPFEI
jgi:hypothetical protein